MDVHQIIRKIFLINFICHLLFVLSLTANVIFAARLGRCNMTVSHSQELDLACVFNQYNESSLPRLIMLHFEKENYLKPVGFILSLGPSLIGFTFVFVKELIQAITSPKKYSQSTINYVDIGLIMACLGCVHWMVEAIFTTWTVPLNWSLHLSGYKCHEDLSHVLPNVHAYLDVFCILVSHFVA